MIACFLEEEVIVTHMKKSVSRIAAVTLTAILALVSASGCGNTKKEEKTLQATKVETQKAVRGTLELTSTYVGTVSPSNSVNIMPLVSGTVDSVRVKVGDVVSAGDVLCHFDDKAAELQMQSARDAVQTAKAGKAAAQDQISSAKKQANVNITSLKGQRDTLKKQRESSQKQLDTLKKNVDQLKLAQEQADKAYAAAKAVYDGTNNLFIRYQSFLTANPDCATTAGLMAASIPETKVVTEVTGGFKENQGNVMVFSSPDYEDGGEEKTPSGDSGKGGGSSSKTVEVESQKQKTAAALLKGLGEVPITVEYLSATGLNTLRDQMEQAKALSASAQSGYSQASTSITQLESSIKQIDSQIKAMDKNISAAKSAANAGGGTQVYDAQIQAAQTGVESAQYQKDLYTVTAPISGIIESVNVVENQLFAQGQPAFTISDKEIMTVAFYVPEEVRNHLNIGDGVILDPGKTDLKGSISSIATSVDPQKGLFKVEADITSITDRKLLSNTSMSLSLVSDSVQDEILIPFDAVYYDNDQAYVFIAERAAEGAKAMRRNVTAGLYSDDQIAILEGLSEGDEVITTWGAGLKDGAAVEIMDGTGGTTEGNS